MDIQTLMQHKYIAHRMQDHPSAIYMHCEALDHEVAFTITTTEKETLLHNLIELITTIKEIS